MILEYNLQFFADGAGGEKTEPATEKKLSDARKEGQVAKSKEVANALGILSLFVILKLWIGLVGNQFLQLFSDIYKQIPDSVINWNGYLPQKAMYNTFFNMLIRTIIIAAPIFAVSFVVAFVADLFQVKWMITSKPLKPKFSKLNPISGFKRIFSVNSLVELIKAILKIGLIGYVVYSFLKDRVNDLFILYDIPLMQALSLIFQILIDLGIRISAVYIIIALADYIYQKFKFAKDMRMTKQEIKDEYKQQEGDPQIKAKIRQKMQEVSRRRMMQSLPQADVVITNPTHFAVAVKYDPDTAEAPVVLAKGADFMAQKIKQVAKEHDIEIVENKILARTLYNAVEVGEMIPPELYQGVAEVLAFVYHLKGKA